jgi:hypothetical protein
MNHLHVDRFRNDDDLTEIIAGQQLEIVRQGKDRFGRTLASIRWCALFAR